MDRLLCVFEFKADFFASMIWEKLMHQTTVRLTCAALAAAAALFASFAGTTQASTKDEDALMQRERDSAQAWLKLDAKFVDEYEATEYVFTSFDGSVTGKADDMKTLKSGTSAFKSFVVDDMKVTVFGDAAVVIGRVTLQGSYIESDMTGVFRFTDTFVKRDGRWQCVASALTRVARM
ncbi:MAG: nuclear transport factor 2 family protein [Gammaproteobacteria bacterium]